MMSTGQTDSALVDSETRYRRLFESAKDGILILDAETGMVEDVNPFLINLLGYSREDFLGKRVWELGSFSNLTANADKFAELQAKEYVRYENLPLETADGHVREVEFVSNVYLAGGKRVIQCNIRDITERKRIEKYRNLRQDTLQILNEPGGANDFLPRVVALLKAQAGFDAVGIRLQDGDDFPYVAQDGFSEAFIRTENTLVERGKNGDVCRDENGNICLECTCGLVLSGKTDPANPMFTPGGSAWTNAAIHTLAIPPAEDPRHHPRNECVHQGYASVAMVPIRDKERIVGLIQFNDKQPNRFTLEIMQILEDLASHIGSALMRTKAEQALMLKSMLLEAQKEAEAKLSAQLRQAQKMEAVGRLAGGVAHDFNNLLMGIMGYTELCLAQAGPDHQMREWLDAIMHTAKRSADITRQLLAFARKQIIAPKLLDLNDSITGILKLVRHLIGEDITLAWRPGANLHPVKIDPAQVDQILANLCVNARDAIAGTGEIMIKTANTVLSADDCARHPGMVPGAYVVLDFSDNGCGMDTETLAMVFEPFFTTKEVGKGTGLGLATVYGIVTQNHGFIDVSSEPGKGTTFRVFLPQAAAVPAEASGTRTAKPEVPKGKGETVLLVEDEASLRTTCSQFLKNHGYNVMIAETPADALTQLAQHPDPIQLLLTDVIMPGMNGQDLAKRVVAERSDMRVLFMSGYTADVLNSRGVLDKGMQFMPKPFSGDALARKVRTLLDEDR